MTSVFAMLYDERIRRRLEAMPSDVESLLRAICGRMRVSVEDTVGGATGKRETAARRELVSRLNLAGRSPLEICRATGFSTGVVYGALNAKRPASRRPEAP